MARPLVRNPRRTALAWLAVGVPLAAAAGWVWETDRARDELAQAGWAQVALYQANLRTELEKHAAVPFALARADEMADLLQDPTPERIDRSNRKLEDIARVLPASALYVMAADGMTVAASNWNAPDSFVGRNFAFRPYFRDAVERGEGHHFALGTTSLVPGFYTAHRVSAENRDSLGHAENRDSLGRAENRDSLGRAENRTLGAVVLKVGFDGLESAWRAGFEKLAVTGRDGVVFITNVESWRFHLLPAATAAHAPEDGYEALPWRSGGDDDVTVTAGEAAGRYLLQTAAVPGGDWTLHVLTALDPVRARARIAALLAAAGVGLAGLAGLVLAQRRRALRDRLAWQEEARRDAERRVAQATTELRARENDLVQAAKLAALGQVSAGIAHEINQPLAAIRTFADNARVLLERGKAASVADNLAEIAALTDRMAAITRHLKGFARRAGGTLGAVDAGRAVRDALAILEAKLRRHDVTVTLDLPDGPVWATAEDVRLQQVLVNLFSNAADAVRGRPRRTVAIRLGWDEAMVTLSVHDSGTGIAADTLPRLFAPFFTTKEAGEGLGLGLSISHGIVGDFGGSIAAANHPGGGAVFTVRLKPVEPSP